MENSIQSNSPIQHVSDTALWVATFRARESERPDALFHDPLARILVGEKGEYIARNMDHADRVSWSVVMRTYVIDDLIQQAIQHGVETIVNLGAGLDTRPYRMNLPESLHWVEVDYPSIIDLKNEKLKEYKPKCRLQRIAQDLTDLPHRRELFDKLNSKAKRVLVLTEGVLPYLRNEDVGTLAQDLRAQDRFTDWIADYYAPFFMQMMKAGKIHRSMEKAPFQFDPPDWKTFFEERGWFLEKMRYLVPEAITLKRYPPAPLWARLLSLFASKKRKEAYMHISGYALLRAR